MYLILHIAKLLAASKADLMWPDNDGKTPEQLGREHGEYAPCVAIAVTLAIYKAHLLLGLVVGNTVTFLVSDMVRANAVSR